MSKVIPGDVGIDVGSPGESSRMRERGSLAIEEEETKIHLPGRGCFLITSSSYQEKASVTREMEPKKGGV